MSIESVEAMPGSDQVELAASQTEALERLSMLIQRLKPLDRQIIVCYLEGMGWTPVRLVRLPGYRQRTSR